MKLYKYFLIVFVFTWNHSFSNTYTVTNIGDNGGVNPAPGAGTGTLRQAIIDANNNSGADIIAFNIGASSYTISPVSALPVITGQVNIKGFTESGVAGTYNITLDGVSAGLITTGLEVSSGGSNSIIRGLLLTRFYMGIKIGVASNCQIDSNVIYSNRNVGILLSSAASTLVRSNKIGTDITGNTDLGNSSDGISIKGTSDNSVIGGSTAASRNLISGNNSDGIEIDNAIGVAIQGNYIGTNNAGTGPVGNSAGGIRIEDGATNTLIGGSSSGQGNVISANPRGIKLNAAVGTIIKGNMIGTNYNGTSALSNTGDGIYVAGVSTNTIIGDSGTYEGNVISGNSINGILMDNVAFVTIKGNKIGTTADGYSTLGNGGFGIYMKSPCTISNCGSAIIGGSTFKEGNVITGNFSGMKMCCNAQAIIKGNRIGTDIDGTSGLANTFDGIYIAGGGSGIVIGGGNTGEGNVIASNNRDGISLAEGTQGTIIKGNKIGIDIDGLYGLGNGRNGILIAAGCNNNVIGGANSGEGNIISENVSHGISITSATGTTIKGNKIGTELNGTQNHGNSGNGITLNGCNNTIIGGANSGEGNLISGSGSDGIEMDNSDGVIIKGNKIGTNSAGTATISNDDNGILVESGSDNTIIGGSGSYEGNLISGNNNDGIEIDNSDKTIIKGNKIGTDITGMLDYGNDQHGIYVEVHSDSTIIGGGNLGEGNLVSGNNSQGIQFTDLAGITIKGNKIGTNSAGIAALYNDGHGIYGEENSTGVIIGGAGIGEGNLISGNMGEGIKLFEHITGSVIKGNKIGTDITGMLEIGNKRNGILVEVGSNNTIIGGANQGEGNLISGHMHVSNFYGGGHETFRFYGIDIKDIVSGTIIKGNKIGTNILGTAAIPNYGGIRVYDGSNSNVIGGRASGEANRIVSLEVGIKCYENARKNLISGNLLYSSKVAIELNDPDKDDGNNTTDGSTAKAAPVITSSSIQRTESQTMVTLSGTIQSGGNRIEIFRSDGKPQNAIEYVGSVVTNSTSWSISVPAGGFNNYFVATAIDTTGSDQYNTSELSNMFTVTISCETCIGSFAPVPGSKYVIGAWVKESVTPTPVSYSNSNITLYFGGAGITAGPFAPASTSNIIDGWQRIEGIFEVPAGASDIKVNLNNTSLSGVDVFFDDIRIHPFDASMKSFVYDPITQRLVAELDENNYATLYEYDEEGSLIRVKKETERGIMTIKESRNNVKKKMPTP